VIRLPLGSRARMRMPSEIRFRRRFTNQKMKRVRRPASRFETPVARVVDALALIVLFTRLLAFPQVPA
jgi:hypothetical protein